MLSTTWHHLGASCCLLTDLGEIKAGVMTPKAGEQFCFPVAGPLPALQSFHLEILSFSVVYQKAVFPSPLSVSSFLFLFVLLEH